VKPFRSMIFVLLPLLIASCTTLDESECATADWRAIGLEDGARGRPAADIASHREACAEYGVTPDLAAYQSGHQMGARQFCTAHNGFRQGRAGRAYHGVCPDDLAVSFRAAYNTGLNLHNLDANISILHREVGDLRKDLAAVTRRHQAMKAVLVTGGLSARDRELMLEQFRELQQEMTELSIDIRETEHEAALTQGEYDVLNASHDY
jgi:hypothetical protein